MQAYRIGHRRSTMFLPAFTRNMHTVFFSFSQLFIGRNLTLVAVASFQLPIFNGLQHVICTDWQMLSASFMLFIGRNLTLVAVANVKLHSCCSLVEI